MTSVISILQIALDLFCATSVQDRWENSEDVIIFTHTNQKFWKVEEELPFSSQQQSNPFITRFEILHYEIGTVSRRCWFVAGNFMIKGILGYDRHTFRQWLSICLVYLVSLFCSLNITWKYLDYNFLFPSLVFLISRTIYFHAFVISYFPEFKSTSD